MRCYKIKIWARYLHLLPRSLNLYSRVLGLCLETAEGIPIKYDKYIMDKRKKMDGRSINKTVDLPLEILYNGKSLTAEKNFRCQENISKNIQRNSYSK